ncbi:MAG: FAD-binding protein, partial [Chloroflexi bacterium]|nr:FAD-binding protein [Chloroflexota bacterium]
MFEHEADVLVIGSGFGGCVAASVAAERGVKNVAIISKGTLISGGTGAPGINNLRVFPPFPVKMFTSAGDLDKTWTPEEGIPRFWKRYEEDAQGLLNKEMTQLYVERSWEMVKLLESFGIQMTNNDVGGEYLFTTIAGGLPGITFEDSFVIQPKLGKYVMKHKNIKVFERTMAVDLLTRDGKVCGAISFNIRTGEIVVVYSKTIILATGSCFRLYENSTGVPYSARHSPYNTGDSQAMTLRAGGVLVSMEIVQWSSAPEGFTVPGVSVRSAFGARWKNALGERVMEKYYPQSKENVQRYQIARAILEEYEKGCGPVFLDITHLPDQIRDIVLKRYRPRTIQE